MHIDMWRAIGVAFISSLVAVFLSAMSGYLAEYTWSYYALNATIVIVVSAAFTDIYFKGRHNEASAKTGFYFGLTIILVQFIAGIIAGLSGMANSTTLDYATPEIIASLVLVALGVASTTGAGWYIGKKK
jgi:hypothetical protein